MVSMGDEREREDQKWWEVREKDLDIERVCVLFLVLDLFLLCLIVLWFGWLGFVFVLVG